MRTVVVTPVPVHPATKASTAPVTNILHMEGVLNHRTKELKPELSPKQLLQPRIASCKGIRI